MTYGSTETPEKNPKSQLKQPAGQLKNWKKNPRSQLKTQEKTSKAKKNKAGHLENWKSKTYRNSFFSNTDFILNRLLRLLFVAC